MDQYIAEEKRRSGGLRDLLIILFKHKSKILITFLATVISVTAGSFLLPPTYEAKSTLLVKFGREFIYRPEVGEKPSDSRSSIAINQEEIINSEIQIMTSRDLVEKVITTLGMENIYPDILESPPRGMTALEASARGFEKNLNVEGIKKSNVIEVSFQHKDPQMAAKAVNTLIEFFREKHLQVMSDPKSSFLVQQLSSYEQKLKASENEMEAFRQKNKVYSLDEQRTLLLRQRMELDTAYKDSANRISELREKVASLRKQMLNISKNEQHYTETDRYKVIDEIKAKLFNLQLQEQQLLNRYREDSTLVVNIRKEIKLA
ncbi:MAG: Wzz/FepE/Etk N-terminal domain-containing protein, partial [Deltaproteobacteria bacterium]|nr:Wzz/FepE/Etk N-terminal domain-containing protein [Deltaproteobacteria bacterium]